MCGIGGVVGLGRTLTDEHLGLTRRMLAALRHRGPDGRGVLGDSSCALGNTRLKIIDLSDNAALPMEDDRRSVRLAYNGEITNFRELDARFGLSKKYKFRSSSDAEVLIYLYRQLGPDCFQLLTGMFAFCLYDRPAGRAFLVRDFYGLRPLFYAAREGELYFASEIKALLEVPGLAGKVDEEAMFHYFSLAYIPGPRTPFRDIHELEGGGLVEIDVKSGRWEKRRYYSHRYEPDRSVEPAGAAERLHELLLDSLRRNLISDVPVGLTLSGGVDTGALLALSKELGVSSDLHTFSIKMAEPSFDESRYQRILVDFARPVHHEVLIRPEDVLPNLLAQVAYMDEPTGDGAAIPLFLLAKEAKKHVSVLLSGEGGDEIFDAYETHRAYKARKLYRRWVPAPLRAAARGLARRLPVSHSKLSFDFVSKRFTEGAEMDVPSSHFYWRHAWADQDKLELVRKRGFPSTESLFVDSFERLDFEDELDRISWIDLEYYFIGDLMVKNDRMLMAHSIEGRYPYMDRPVVEFAARIPTELKVRGFQGRYIQRLAMKGRMPAQVLRRRNMGLEMPYSPWFLDGFRQEAERYFSRSNVEKTEFLNHEAVARLWQEHLSKKKDNGRALWTVLNYLVWFDLFVYDGDYKRHLL